MNNLDALRQAMNCLKGSGLKMWLYLNKNQDNYRFGLSRVDCAEWGIRKDSYYDGIKDLIANGYLRQSQPGSNLYIFYENALTENPTSGYSEFYFTEKTGFDSIQIVCGMEHYDNRFESSLKCKNSILEKCVIFSGSLVIDEHVKINTSADKELRNNYPTNGFYRYDYSYTKLRKDLEKRI